MNTNGTLLGTRWGPASAIGAQPRQLHAAEVRAGTPTRPWGSRRRPRTLRSSDPRRVLFRTLLRRAEGVEATFADGGRGVVDEVVLSPIGFDFWAETLVVATSSGRRRVPARAVRRIDVREARIWLGPLPAEPLASLAPDRHRRRFDGRRRGRGRPELAPVRARPSTRAR